MTELKKEAILSAGEKTLEDIQKEIAEVIRQQREENQLKESLVELMNFASEVINFEVKANTLATAIGVFEMEGIEIPEMAFIKTEEYDYQKKDILDSFEEMITYALNEMSQEHLLQFAQMYFNINVPHLKFIVGSLTEEHKQIIFDLLNKSEFRDSYDKDLAYRFQKQLNLSLDFAIKNKLIEVEDDFKEYMEFIKKHVNTYTPAVSAMIEWMRDLKTRNLEGILYVRYADSALRKLGISNEDKVFYKNAHEEFMNILKK